MRAWGDAFLEGAAHVFLLLRATSPATRKHHTATGRTGLQSTRQHNQRKQMSVQCETVREPVVGSLAAQLRCVQAAGRR